jgi:uncharacterized protein
VPITPLQIAQGASLTLAFVGCILIWRYVLSGQARADRRPSPLETWAAGWNDFFLFGLCVFLGYLFFGIAGALLAKPLHLSGDSGTIVAAAGAQLGMLLGCFAYYHSFLDTGARPGFGAAREVIQSGLVTFLIALPIMIAVSVPWEFLLKALGLPVNKQDSIEIFMRGESRWLVVLLGFLAVVVAPITEELVFRAGFYRFLRTRFSRAGALLLPGIIFAIPHVNWTNFAGLGSFMPLVALAVVFSLAYERTGRIGTTIVAHALFNLNSIFFLLAGGGKEP